MNFVHRLFFRRPTVLNALHRLRLTQPTSQTISVELEALAAHAKGKTRALEIGSYQGVSAGFIAKSLSERGELLCVDPWLDSPRGWRNPGYLIFERHLRRHHLWNRIRVLRGHSGEVASEIPTDLDFIFVDGDHSWDGLAGDWKIVKAKLAVGGIVCLHDTIVPAAEPWRTLESVRFFKEVITRDPGFRLAEEVHSMTVLIRIAAT